MKIIVILSLLSYLTSAKAQDRKIYFSSNVGYAQFRASNFKKIALTTGSTLSAEMVLNRNIFYSVGIGGNVVRYSREAGNNINSFHAHYYAMFPMSIKKYYTVSKVYNSFVYWEFGITPNYLFRYNIEVWDNYNSSKRIRKNIGWNFGGTGSFGFNTKISKHIFFDIAMTANTDYISIFKKKEDKFKADRRMFTMGFSRLL